MGVGLALVAQRENTAEAQQGQNTLKDSFAKCFGPECGGWPGRDVIRVVGLVSSRLCVPVCMAADAPDFYSILGVARDADANAIKRGCVVAPSFHVNGLHSSLSFLPPPCSFRRIVSRAVYSERGGGDVCPRATRAYQVLSHAELRAAYDRGGEAAADAASAEAERRYQEGWDFFQRVFGGTDSGAGGGKGGPR